MAFPTDLFPPPGEDSAPSRRVQLLEVLVFLFLVAPSLVFSVFITGQQRTYNLKFIILGTVFRDLALVALILYFLWRNGEPRIRIGWDKTNFFREAAVGGLLFLPFLYGAGILAGLLAKAGLSAPPTSALPFVHLHGKGQFALALLLVVVVAIAEETIFRGYLILRIGSITGSTTAAVVLSSLIFSLGHSYEGTARMATVAAMGVVLALVYLWRRSIVAPMVMHFLQDFIVLVATPLFLHLH